MTPKKVAQIVLYRWTGLSDRGSILTLDYGRYISYVIMTLFVQQYLCEDMHHCVHVLSKLN